MCVQYIGECSVHWGDTISTLGGYHEYIGGIPWVHRGCHEYIRGCSVHRRDTMSTLGDVQYIGGVPWVHRGIPWVHRGISWVHQGDIMSTSGDVQYIRVFNRNWKDFIKLLPHMYHDIPPMYWTSPDVLMIFPDVLMVSLRFTEHPPMYSWYPPTFIMISSWCTEHPQCTHDIPRCTEHPLMYWTSPDVLNIPRCTEHPPMYWTHIIQGVNGVHSCFSYTFMWENKNFHFISTLDVVAHKNSKHEQNNNQIWQNKGHFILGKISFKSLCNLK